jgi:hypothetical protein
MKIKFTHTSQLITLEDVQAALQSQENLLDSWIQHLHSPSSLELMDLHDNIKSIKLLIARNIGDNNSLAFLLSLRVLTSAWSISLAETSFARLSLTDL